MVEVLPGDQLLDERGRPCTVTAVSPVFRDREVYTVRTDDGDEVVADADHLWRAQLDRGAGPGASAVQAQKKGRGRFRLHTTAVLARKRGKRALIERAAAPGAAGGGAAGRSVRARGVARGRHDR